jgi:indole-3-glycerol phosphate synthase
MHSGKVEKLEATVAQQQKQIQTLTAQLKEQAQTFTAQLKEQAAQIQKVSVQLELSKAAPASGQQSLKSTPPRPSSQHFTISGRALLHGGFLFRSKCDPLTTVIFVIKLPNPIRAMG